MSQVLIIQHTFVFKINLYKLRLGVHGIANEGTQDQLLYSTSNYNDIGSGLTLTVQIS